MKYKAIVLSDMVKFLGPKFHAAQHQIRTKEHIYESRRDWGGGLV